MLRVMGVMFLGCHLFGQNTRLPYDPKIKFLPQKVILISIVLLSENHLYKDSYHYIVQTCCTFYAAKNLLINT